jgi:inner membrane protein
MDPLSHLAFGRTLAALRPMSCTDRGLTAAAMLGALAPDLDAVVMPFGWDRYLRVHEVGTHAVAGGLACAVLAAALVRTRARQTAMGRLWLFASAGALSHLALDVGSGARIALGWPLAPGRVSVPLVAMADPYLVSLFVLIAFAIWLGRRHRRRVAVAGIALLAIFLGAKGAAGRIAAARYERAANAAGRPVLSRAVEARWGSLTAWHVFDRTDDGLRVWLANAGGAAPVLLFEWPTAPEGDAVRASRTLSTVRNFLAVHDLTFATALPSAGGGTVVLWSDVRYCWNPDEPGAPAAQPTVTAPSGARMGCGLWFGGELDAGGMPVSGIVRVGGWTQARQPEP